MNEPVPPPKPVINSGSYKKSWYQFWGGKKTRKYRTKRRFSRKFSHRRR